MDDICNALNDAGVRRLLEDAHDHAARVDAIARIAQLAHEEGYALFQRTAPNELLEQQIFPAFLCSSHSVARCSSIRRRQLICLERVRKGPPNNLFLPAHTSHFTHTLSFTSER